MRFIVMKGLTEVGVINARRVDRVSSMENKDYPTIYKVFDSSIGDHWGMLILEKGVTLIREESATIVR